MMKLRLRLLVLTIAMISIITAISGCSQKDPEVESKEAIVNEESEEKKGLEEVEEAIEPQNADNEEQLNETEEAKEPNELEEVVETEDINEPEEVKEAEVVKESDDIKEAEDLKSEKDEGTKDIAEPEKDNKPEAANEPENDKGVEDKKEVDLVEKPEEIEEVEEVKEVQKDNESVTPTEEDSKEEIVIGSGIKDIYGQYDLLAGTCINENVIRRYTDHIIENYNSVTMENEMKPDAILSRSKSIAAGDLVVEYPRRTLNLLDWAKENKMKVRGHTLVWHSQTPDWIFYKDFNTSKGLVDRDTMLARMESYIKQNFELLNSLGYIDMFYAYDVVNEAIDGGNLRNSKWKEIIGDDYIWYAFYYADKYAPEHIKLYYNDYNEQFKTNQVVNLAKSLVDDDGRYLIDGIGCQGHLYTNDSIDTYIRTLEAFSATGLDVQITEIDVSLGSWQNIQPATEENLKKQGKYYYELVNKIIEGKNKGKINLSGITFWGVSDGSSWRSNRSPLLFNRNMEPKYAYYGAIQDKDKAGY